MYKLIINFDNQESEVYQFKSLEEMDKLTIKYKDKLDLLGDLLGVNNNLENGDIYIKYNQYDKKYPIRYQEDNYTYDNFKLWLIEYYQKNPKEILKTPVKFESFSPIKNYVFDNIKPSDEDIRFAVTSYLKNDYVRLRNMYFAKKKEYFEDKQKHQKKEKQCVVKESNNEKITFDEFLETIDNPAAKEKLSNFDFIGYQEEIKKGKIK